MNFRNRSKWSRAVPTISCGIKFPSKTEARVYERLRLEAMATGARLYRNVRFPLFGLQPEATGTPFYFNPDFVVIEGDRMRVVDAKSGKRRSPEWARGKAAFEAEYMTQVEEVSK